MKALARSYLFAHFGKGLMWHGGNVAFAFYLTEICEQSPATMAWLLAASSILNAVADGVIGTALARRMQNGTSASRHQLAGSVAAGVAFAAFCAAGLMPDTIRLGYALVTLFAFRIAYSFVDVPQNALLAYIPADTDRQEGLIASRMMAGYAAQVTTALLISVLLLRPSTSNALYFATAGAGVATTAIGSAWAFRRHWGNRSEPRLTARSDGATEPAARLSRLLVACAVFAFASALVIRLQAYIAVYGSATGGTNTAFVPVAMAIGGLAGQPLWAMLCRRHGVRATLKLSSVALIGSALPFGAAASSAALPVAIATSLFGAALGGTSFALWALLARSALDGNAAMRFGIFTCTSKLAHALSAVALGTILAGGDYRASVGAGADLWSMSMVAAIGMGAILLLLEVRLPRFRKDSCA